jgi:hypothetical protein
MFENRLLEPENEWPGLSNTAASGPSEFYADSLRCFNR